MKQWSRTTRLVTGAGLMLGSVMIAGPGIVEAGVPDPGPEFNLQILTQVTGQGAPDVLAGIEFELYPETAPDVFGSEMKDAVTDGSCESVSLASGGGFAFGLEGCEVLDGSYRLGISGVPDAFDVHAFCGTDLGIFFGGREILEPGPFVEPDITIGLDPVSCIVVLFDGAPLTVDFVAPGVGHDAALADLTPEAYPLIEVPDADPALGPNAIGDDTCTSQSRVGPGGAFFFAGPPAVVSTAHTFSCDIPDDDYRLGMDGLVDGYTRSEVFCVPADLPFFVFGLEPIDAGGAEFVIGSDDFGASAAYCHVSIAGPPSILLDAVVTSGTASPSDFGLEVFAADGGLLAEVTDPSTDECVVVDDGETGAFFPPLPTLDHTACAGFALAAGEYELGATLPEYGYVVESVFCEAIEGDFGDERLGSELGGFTHPVVPPSGPFALFSQCAVEFEFVEQTASASVAVINAFGGDAVESDFTIEVFDTAGDLVVSAPAPATFTLPIGTYDFGVSGPDDYATTVEVTIEDVVTEEFPGDTGQFTLTQAARATATISAIQLEPVVTTTTTTTTTTVAPTTAAPATAAPTTAAPTTQLPATGSENSSLLWFAAALVLLGAGSVLVARRRRNLRW